VGWRWGVDAGAVVLFGEGLQLVDLFFEIVDLLRMLIFQHL
jgi:hypothetical protein